MVNLKKKIFTKKLFSVLLSVIILMLAIPAGFTAEASWELSSPNLVSTGSAAAGTYMVKVDTSLIERDTHSTSGKAVGSYKNGAIVEITEVKNGFGKIRNKNTWLSMDYLIFQTPFTGLVDIKEGWYYIASAQDTSYKLDQQFALTSNGDGGKVVLQKDNGGDNQIVYVKPLGNRAHLIIFKHSNKVLETSNNSTELGSQLQQWDRADGAFSQEWYCKPTKDGNYMIINRLSGLAIDIFENKHGDGVKIVQWTADENDKATNFKLIPVTEKKEDPATSAIKGADGAVAWTKSMLGSKSFNGLCLKFIRLAYENGSGIKIGNFASAQASANAKKLTKSYNNIPIGALVFFSYDPYGHVGIYIGNDEFIHATSADNKGVIISKLSTYAPSRYLGWAYPY